MRILYILVAVGLSGCRPSTNRPSDPKTSKPKKVNDDEKKPLNDDTEEIENSLDKENGDIPAPHVIQPSHHVPKLNPGHVIPPKDTAAPITKPNSGHVIEPKNPVPISKTFEAHTPDMPKSTPPKEGLFKEEITLESPKIEDGTKKKPPPIEFHTPETSNKKSRPPKEVILPERFPVIPVGNRGQKNNVNTCYFNALIQSMVHLDLVHEYANRYTGSDPVIRSFTGLVSEHWNPALSGIVLDA
jgi:hypothetical protein